MASGDNVIDLDIDPIDVSEYPVPDYEDEPKAHAYNKTLCQDNKDFTNFINRCLLLDQTFEMEKIIQKILLPAYVGADDDYKKSAKFARVVKKALQRLIDEPRKKYSHISDVTDTLKFHVKKLTKKRVDFVTLSTTSVLGKTKKTNRKRVVDNKNISPSKQSKKSKKPKLDVIAVDSEDDDNLIAAGDTASNIVPDDELITVGDTSQKTFDDNLLAAHDIAKQLFNQFTGCGKVHTMEVDSDLTHIDQKANEGKVGNLEATTKPNKNESNNEIIKKIKEKLTFKKSKHRITFESDDESHKKIRVNIKDTKSIGKIGNNNNMLVEIIDSQDTKIQEEIQIRNNERNISVNAAIKETKNIQYDKENLDKNENLCDFNNKLLVPQMEIALEEKIPNKLNDTERYERIKAIEIEIVKYKKKIADLEVAEVTEDSTVSAYIRCDRLQAHIVKLYKELCSLNEAKPVKGRQVRLHQAEGLPGGPVRRLEKFLNKQVDEDGVAPFPDFADVVRCVEKSNVKDGLGWSKTKVHKEAQALFEHSGRALQKRRQRREWKDLRSQVSREDFDADPAANDPELAAKLELNRQLALKKEAEVLEKFTRMEATSEKDGVQQNNKTQDTDEADSSSDEETEQAGPKPYKTPETETREKEIGEPIIRIKEEPYEVPIYFSMDSSIVIEISDSDSSEDSCVE